MRWVGVGKVSVRGKTLTSILGLNPLDAKASPGGDIQECLQTSPSVPWLRMTAVIPETFLYAKLLVNLFLLSLTSDQMVKKK